MRNVITDNGTIYRKLIYYNINVRVCSVHTQAVVHPLPSLQFQRPNFQTRKKRFALVAVATAAAAAAAESFYVHLYQFVVSVRSKVIVKISLLCPTRQFLYHSA